ncbi:MAG TPA: glycosyltransferase, partial [Burkholderiaceae bacterium]|nr:glycosyltransferase [Burkholderiaceae bacterium]
MRITWLLEQADQIWGGIKVALEDANWLSARGHRVTVLSRSGPPAWMALRCQFRTVPDFRTERLPEADVLIGTWWSTMPAVAAAGAGRGAPVHFCQGYEGDFPEQAPQRESIEAAYRLPGVHHIAISPHVAALLQRRFRLTARAIPNAIDHSVHYPGAARPPGGMLRIGLVGPWQVPWKDLATGVEACRRAAAAGQPLQLVRVTNTQPDAAELDLPFPVEWHQRVAPRQMGDIYRSLDVFLGTSSGPEEGFHLPAVEAMACGVPCVLTDVPCFRAHGDGQYAMFVPPRDPAAMAEALVVAGRVDDVRSALRTAGIAAAARYTQQAHGQALEQALLAIAVQGRAQTRSALRAPPMPADADAGTAARTDAPAGAQEPGPAGDLDGLEAELARSLQRAGERAARAGEPARADRLRAAARCLSPVAAPAGDAPWRRWLVGDKAAALQKLDELAASGVDDPALHEQRGLLLHDCGRDLEAAQSFRAAIAAGGASADAFNNLGVALWETGDVAGARASFERALHLQPTHRDAT